VSFDGFGNPETATKQLNDLADDGWEYVGPIQTNNPGSGRTPPQGGLIAFKRPKR
jgi:hypothetical protein